MRALTKVFGIAATAGVLLATTLSPASADTIDSTVSGGSISATTSGATLTGVTLNGTDQTVTGNASSAWSITDARGTGEVWTLSVTAGIPTSAAGSVPTETAKTLPIGGLKIAPGTITEGSGADDPATISGPTLAMTGSQQALVSATGPNKGTYTLTPVYSLDVPANAFRSNYSGAVGSTPLNPYISTITYTIG